MRCIQQAIPWCPRHTAGELGTLRGENIYCVVAFEIENYITISLGVLQGCIDHKNENGGYDVVTHSDVLLKYR